MSEGPGFPYLVIDQRTWRPLDPPGADPLTPQDLMNLIAQGWVCATPGTVVHLQKAIVVPGEKDPTGMTPVQIWVGPRPGLVPSDLVMGLLIQVAQSGGDHVTLNRIGVELFGRPVTQVMKEMEDESPSGEMEEGEGDTPLVIPFPGAGVSN